MAIEFFDDSNGINDVIGFSAGAAACNIRGNADLARLDVAVIFSKTPCTAAGAFTTNDVKAAPVYVSQAHLRGAATGTLMHGIVATSGNANACTGEQGMKDANIMCELAASACGVAVTISATAGPCLCRFCAVARKAVCRRGWVGLDWSSVVAHYARVWLVCIAWRVGA